MPRELLSNRLNTFQASELEFENSGVGSNGLRSSRIKKTKKKMNVQGAKAGNGSGSGSGSIEDSCMTIGRLGTCGPGASYRMPKRRRNICREMQPASDMTGTGLDFDAQMSSFNVNVPPRRCCAPVLDQCCSSINNWL